MAITVLNTDAGLSGKTIVTAEGAHTVDGLHTFDRDPNAPFAVSAGSAVVTNLDADKLDGQEGSYYRDASNLNAGTVPASVLPGGQYHCVVYNNGTQAINNDTTTNVTFDSEELDTGALHSTASNTDRITIPAGAGGIYLVIGRVSFAGNSTGYRQLRLVDTGTDIHIVNVTPVSATDATLVEISTIVSLSAGDYITMSAYQNSGGSLNIGNASTRLVQNELRAIRLT